MIDTVADELAIRTHTAAINRGHVTDAIVTHAPDATFTMTDRPAVVGRDGIAAVPPRRPRTHRPQGAHTWEP